MERLGYGFFKLLFSILALATLGLQPVMAQYEPLTLLETSSLNGDETVQFSFKFESESASIDGQAESFIEDYDSIAVTSLEFVDRNNEKLLKMNAFVVNKETNHRLKWITIVDYVEIAKSSGEVIASNNKRAQYLRSPASSNPTSNTNPENTIETPIANVSNEREEEPTAAVIDDTNVVSNELTNETSNTAEKEAKPSEALEPSKIGVDPKTTTVRNIGDLREYTHKNESGKEVVYKEAKKLISGKFIQFGAFDIFNNATNELARIKGFRMQMIRVNNQYKLISPYTKGDFKTAKEKYPEKKVWPATYQQKELIVLEEQ